MYLIPILPKELQQNAPWTIYAAYGPEGQCDLKEFLGHQPANFQAYATGMLALLEHVADCGPLKLPDTLCHQIAEGIWEFIKGRLRVFWFYDEGKLIICSHGHVKRTQNTPDQEIERVERFKREYFAAKQMRQLIIKEGE